MKTSVLIFLLYISTQCLGQETVERTRKLTPDVTERYHVLKNNDTVMQGVYGAYLAKTMVAAGRYENNKKAGTWTFFDQKGVITQRFNYSTNVLVYEAPVDSTNKSRYIVDDSLKNNPQFTRPVRIGGKYYGFLKYLNLVKLPDSFIGVNNERDRIAIELLISPGGRLASFKLRIGSAFTDYSVDDEILNLNLKLLAEEDKIFLPATLNGEPVSVRMIIPCLFYKGNRIRLK